MKGGMGGLDGLMKQAQQMQKQMSKVQEDLKSRVVEGTSGGGMVTAYVNGHRELLKIKLDPQILEPDEKEMVEDLVVAAVGQAMKKAEEMAKAEMAKATGGLSFPGLI